jgi:hypothetical protein
MLRNFNKKRFVLQSSFVLFLSLSVLFLSCKNEKKFVSSQTLFQTTENENIPLKLKKISEDTKSYIEGKNVLVILGYGYNDEENVTKITQNLNTNFGVETEDKNGLVSIFVYPQDFMVAGKERISSLADKVEDKNLAGMIILGAPEGLHIALSKIQDKSENGKINYPIFTLFSQDDVLGTESTSDFVLDYAHKTNTIEGEVTDFIPDFDAASILVNCVSEIIELREPLKADSALPAFVKKLLDKNRNLVHYVDGETGLQSINHFIFE